MRKNILGLSSILLSSLLLAACGSQTPASSSLFSSSSSSAGPQLKSKAVEIYRTSTIHVSASFYFEDAMPEIPFIALEDARDILVST